VRISVTIPEELLRELDKLVATSFRSRSRAVAEAVRMLVESFGGELGGRVVGIVVYRYRGHHTAERLRELEHRYLDVVLSVLHVHASEDECVEALAVRGDYERVQQLISELGRVHGVESLQRALTSVGS